MKTDSVYGDLFSAVEKHGWKIGESEVLMCEGGKALIFKIHGEGPADVVDALSGFEYILSASAS